MTDMNNCYYFLLMVDCIKNAVIPLANPRVPFDRGVRYLDCSS